MADLTNENTLKQKLEFLGLSLENIPEFLTQYENLDYRISGVKDELKEVVYKYIPINKIQILLTPDTKSSDLRKRYLESLPLYRYLKIQEHDEIERSTIFLGMLNNFSIEEVEKIKQTQEKLNKEIPFAIKYPKSYLWEIYYSQVTDTYFMMVPLKDMNFNYMFYLLREQIKFNKNKTKNTPKIYVPITGMPYSREILNMQEIRDIENYLWVFTGEWAKTYEVFEDAPTIHIVGDAKVYEGIKTQYKIRLATYEEAHAFYKEIKAFFILQTELNPYYKFNIKINNDSLLEFYYMYKRITYNDLSDFIKKEYVKIENEIIIRNDFLTRLQAILQKTKAIAREKENEFLEKEKQISSFLKYKKTFFGKIHYYFKSKKPIKIKLDEPENEGVKEAVNFLPPNPLEDKGNYTIEDLVVIYSYYDKLLKDIKNIELDIEAQEHKVKNLETKIKNATIYIKEIETHKKSIFEFWKFANKDELPALSEGTLGVDTNKKIKKTFNYEFDFEELGNKMDKLQRSNLSKEEQNDVFISSTEIIDGINAIKNVGANIVRSELSKTDNLNNKTLITDLYNKLKEEASTGIVGNVSYDIFGSLSDDRTKIRSIANKHHRELERIKLQVLDVNRVTEKQFAEKLAVIAKNITEAVKKVSSPFDLSIYKVSNKDIVFNKDEFEVCNLDAVTCMEEYSNKAEKQVFLFKINIKENMPMLFYTNIIFYNNTNQTLPIGMNLSNKVLIDKSLFDFVLREKLEFKTNMYCDNLEEQEKLVVKNVIVCEYDVRLK
ncbi:MAG: hypothetical protein FWF46_07080 [Oscillospiraceae bacterium]|nr:hypothetical protein [Oscillospiraceae bacterium]